ncbi:MAG: phosphoribosylglycinamide formyltransferase [Candidatus Omnitrophica bacterium]|nr:phosphoribosylglycinamide formyltransferase [Candidatus Omnitrophota bacterium]MCM8791217.1 phosphoribosylglycinamide formyltransferase [Candidatus Omnitrophota bacterium]
MNISVLCSGSGTNLQAIIDSVRSGYIPAKIALVVSDRKDAFALERAKKAGVETLVLNPKDFRSREDFDKEVVKNLRARNVGLVVLAGFMRLLSPYFIREYRNKIMNIHPALLPSFKGTCGIKDALEYGVKVTGPTVHFVDEELDHGPIILQRAVEIKEDDTPETLLERVHAEEHRIYPEAIKLFVEGRLKIEGRRVRII